MLGDAGQETLDGGAAHDAQGAQAHYAEDDAAPDRSSFPIGPVGPFSSTHGTITSPQVGEHQDMVRRFSGS
ncbi:hypothetical protein GCM10009839_11140 [Catenulispora yoronensis]|uniref:Uncharacterized protein n=1 Tax=Catenulispora yoronensis TaxID=450799 RepID=A0ABP5F7B1_9ACTN